jgi:predicted exporter
VKKPFLLCRNKRLPLYLWIIPHAGVFLALLLLALSGRRIGINTSLLDILPKSSNLKTAAAAEKALSDKTSQSVCILAASADFTAAKRAAEDLERGFSAAGVFENISLHADTEFLSRFGEYLHTYRYALLDAQTRELLESGETQKVADEALAAAFGVFTLTSLDTIESDPFLFAEREMRRFLALYRIPGSLTVKEGVPAALSEGLWYVPVRGSLAPSGLAVAGKNRAVEKIYAVCAQTASREAGVRFVYSGVPFHSYESSSRSQKEITLISCISFSLLGLLLVFVFRSLLPVLFSLGAIALSLLFALALTLLVFGEIHTLSFVFGTTLIGVCVDYSLHYFVHWKASASLKSGAEIRAYLRRGITMSFVSSEICFAAMFFTPFMILRQFAAFSFAGLLSSFLTVMCLYPYIKSPPVKRNLPGMSFTRTRVFSRLPRKIILAGIIALASVFLFVHRDAVRIENDIRGFYTMTQAMRESEQTASRVLNYETPGWYFILAGDTSEELLRREEELASRLEKEIAAGSLASFMATSVFVPSRGIQEKNYEAVKKMLPLAERQIGVLGLPAEAAEAFRRDFAEAEGKYVSPEQDIPSFLKTLLSNLWIGKIEGKYYSCVLPLRPAGEDIFRALAEDIDSVYFVNKVRDIGTELDRLTRAMLLLFSAAWFVICVIVRFFYTGKNTLRICCAPFMLALVAAAALAADNIAVGFFPAAGFVLVFGLGLDYIFYMIESGKSLEGRSLTFVANTLSFLTTAASFGALALSGFAPVHMFGLTVFSGLVAAFISAILLSGKVSAENQNNSGGET